MKVTQRDVQYVANLANLELTDDERARMEKDLNAILDHIDGLAEVDTTNVEPMAQVMQVASSATLPADVLRSDEPRPSLPREVALANAPQSDGAFFRVPKVIER
jgi:aspartyl-tRNA(Asn)/glutamyl-tRNA(Gln) amidotransferase subunit C